MLIETILRSKGSDVATVRPDARVGDVVEELKRRNIGALVVSEDEVTVIGIISERDVVRALPDAGTSVLDRTVADLMTTDVATCDMQASAAELMQLMTTRRIRHVPVVDSGRLVGLVSIGDVVRNRVDELEVEAKTLHEYLTSGR
jgi:CBS domain-containing protein